MGPAGPAVLRDVLVAKIGKIVYSVNVVPDPVLGGLNCGELGSEHWFDGAGVLLTASEIAVLEGDRGADKEGNYYS